MANGYSSSVIRVDTSAAFAKPLQICAIKYIGATASSAVTIRGNASASGETIWQDSGSSTTFNGALNIRDSQGVHVTIAGGAVAYLYTK